MEGIVKFVGSAVVGFVVVVLGTKFIGNPVAAWVGGGATFILGMKS